MKLCCRFHNSSEVVNMILKMENWLDFASERSIGKRTSLKCYLLQALLKTVKSWTDSVTKNGKGNFEK